MLISFFINAGFFFLIRDKVGSTLVQINLHIIILIYNNSNNNILG